MQDSSRQLSLSGLVPPREIRILGAGRFGYMAAQRLSRRYPDTSFLVIDIREDKLSRIRNELGVSVRLEDAITFLAKAPLPDDVWIVPAVPVHVAYQWLLARLGGVGKVHALPVPEIVDRQTPNPYRAASGTVYTSFAAFLCPDACNEPEKICTFTGKARQGNLFEQLSRMKVPGLGIVVVRSRQLAPGVGGYTGSYLESKLYDISQRAGAYLVATSCRCHGVMDVLEWTCGWVSA